MTAGAPLAQPESESGQRQALGVVTIHDNQSGTFRRNGVEVLLLEQDHVHPTPRPNRLGFRIL
jgi:hypothetical protein